jgi:U2 small nuclear ribonucleoprotein B''
MTEANPTLYVKNLNDKVRPNEMRRSLYLLMSEFGPVVDVAVHKSDKGRGQAWITFADQNTAVTALQRLGQVTMYEKTISASYAKKSKPGASAGKKS